ncbi:MAG: class II aldolase/adducin family protein [Actinobacteria bacterium]|nr:class II aldolase/adducin family protein [Actinomycetota bacterium]
MNESQLRHDICEVCRRIWVKNMVAANDGNVSARLDKDRVLITPTGVSKGFVSPDQLLVVDMDGNKLSGELTPSSETKMHLRVYHRRHDINAVVHAHPVSATAFAIAGIPLDRCVLPEIVLTMGSIPIVEYGTPSTYELPEKLDDYLENYDAFLLENHGALTIGPNVYAAYFKMEALELYSQILMNAFSLGKVNVISAENYEKLHQIRENLKIGGKNPACLTCEFASLKEMKDQGELSGLTIEKLTQLIAEVIINVLKK